MTRSRELDPRSAGACLVIGLAAAAAGCGSSPAPTVIPVPTTKPAEACPMAEMGGRIVASDRWGIAVADQAGRVSRTLWPWGFHGVMTGAQVALVDGAVRLVAHVGDGFTSGGGFVGQNGDPDHTMQICGEIRVSAQ